MKETWKLTWKHEHQPGTMKNQPGTMNSQPGTMNNHKNRPGIMNNQPGTLNNHVLTREGGRGGKKQKCDSRGIPNDLLDVYNFVNWFWARAEKSKQGQYLAKDIFFAALCYCQSVRKRPLAGRPKYVPWSTMADLRLPRGKGFSTVLAARGLRLGWLRQQCSTISNWSEKRQKSAYFLSYLPKHLQKGPLELWPPNIFG